MSLLKLNAQQRKATFAELKAEYLFIAIPFLLLISVKLYIATWQEIILAPEWALASSKAQTSEQHFGWYTAKRFLLVVASITAYFGMLAKPTIALGFIQIFMFFLASVFHFKDGFTTKLLQKNV